MLPDFTQQLMNDSPLYQGALILLVSILLAKMAPLPREAQVFYWYSHLARSLSAKVNRKGRTSSQQKTAGFLAIVLLVVPFWLIITFLIQLAAFPWFFEFIILYLCLCDEQFYKVADETAQALRQDNRPSARALLKNWLFRDTQDLSEVGLAKATIEKLVTIPVYSIVATILFFAIGGAPLVLGARMIKQLEYCWPSVNPQYQSFGKPAYYLSYGLYFLPTLLWNFTLAIQGGPKTLVLILRSTKSRYPVNNHIATCEIAAHVLGIELGGPIKFANTKVSLEKVGKKQKPDASHLPHALKLARMGNTIWVLSVIMIPIIWALLRYLKTAAL
ncbi:cobalamin biosynthesis protein CobD/CbiB [Shewanella psychrotolerans]|uniref:cobalamin biosynthesis protein CobD/CbiB n=1 Tax=Shewanella psychrotolerans TaxID=2864206 RepID=UPI001C660663|nr:cobalamin biosynthesis protein [Shewanella psychrotolerans]QYK00678.1 cobalamin biosynthesis protein [Shewanella psychrotolerans]